MVLKEAKVVKNMNKTTESSSTLELWEAHLHGLVSKHAWLANAAPEELALVRERVSPLRLAACWYHFSVFAADFLCLALPLLENPVNRCYIAQTANEELGCGDPQQVHSVLLLEALAEAGLDQHTILSYPTLDIDQVLEALKQQLLSAKNDHEIAGFFLGFELLAEHNICHVFECLKPQVSSREELLQTPYFEEHFKVEPAHIRRAITLGMNSCAYDYQIKSMLDKFHYTISFWNHFWGVVHQEISNSGVGQFTKIGAGLGEALMPKI
ncbi:iron-containing redox enzyme family protein [Moorena sp. SIO4A5]|uniref:iron-containing redox enzyme family protein n=1 Tax=Moorena sp. SIO4A5 TaxID=2607838 RepID=UPI0025FE1C51|nr:iron-containing redox enzyme family protein [Moorena sp. SIO4A5]